MATTLDATLLAEIRAERLVAAATLLIGPQPGAKLIVWPDRSAGTLGDPALDRQAVDVARTALANQQAERFSLPRGDETWDIFVDVYPPPPKLVIVGAVHIAIPLVTFGKALGFRTIVVDARRAFATPERFAHADELRIGWPGDIVQELNLNETTCFVTLTHDEKLDNPALLIALNSSVRYIGALGSRRTHAARVAALRADGATDAQLARIHAPIGLDLGGRTPEEIAVAIIAQIVQVVNSSEAAVNKG